MKLNDLAKMINKANGERDPAQQLLYDLNNCIQMKNKPKKPRANYKPSMLGGCLRRLFFCRIGTEVEYSPPTPEITGICESGTDRHERIQSYLAAMNFTEGFKWEWIDVGEYVKTHKPKGTKVVGKSGMETKLFNEILELSFMCDGVIRDKETGQYYIVEIKTETSFKYQTHNGIYSDHEIQATCYSVALGINKVIFIYENRDFCSKKAAYIEVTDDMKQRNVLDRIEFVNNYIAEDKVPPKTVSVDRISIIEKKHCKYCNYKKECKKWGDS